MTEYYVSGCIDNGSEVETCDDSEATFWTLYERDAEGLSQGIIDCKFREDAEAAMRVYQERDALQQQVKDLQDKFNFKQNLTEQVVDLQKQVNALAAAHSQLRESMAAIHNTIRVDGVNTSLGALLSASKHAYEDSALTFAAQLRQPEE